MVDSTNNSIDIAGNVLILSLSFNTKEECMDQIGVNVEAVEAENWSDWSAEELQAKLVEITAQEQAAKAALAAKLAEEKADVLAEIKAAVAEYGITAQEIFGRSKGKAAASGRGSYAYVARRDDFGNVYKRGKISNAIKDQATMLGIAPQDYVATRMFPVQ